MNEIYDIYQEDELRRGFWRFVGTAVGMAEAMTKAYDIPRSRIVPQRDERYQLTPAGRAALHDIRQQG